MALNGTSFDVLAEKVTRNDVVERRENASIAKSLFLQFLLDRGIKLIRQY